VTTQYFTLLALVQREDLARDQLDKTAATLELIRARQQAGTVAALDVAQQQALVAQQRAAVAGLGSQRVAVETALALLLGQAPNLPLDVSTTSHVQVPQVAAETPARVLLNRPDVRQAEADLRAAAANVDAARAALFPSLNLSLALQAPIDPASAQTSVAASLLAPIFEGGRLRGALFTSKARQRELVAVYRTTVLTALKEVEDALAATTATRRQVQEQQIAADAASLAARLAEEKFRVGSIDMPTLLDTQRSELAARDSLIQARLQSLAAAVTLIKALGGAGPQG
jgi:NodT family efflux transporter outer membrane factor (OMF) lipoprotein